MYLVAPFLCPSPINTLLLKCFTGSVRNVVVFTGEAALVLGSFLSAFSDLNSSLPSLFSDVWENVFFSFFFFFWRSVSFLSCPSHGKVGANEPTCHGHRRDSAGPPAGGRALTAGGILSTWGWLEKTSASWGDHQWSTLTPPPSPCVSSLLVLYPHRVSAYCWLSLLVFSSSLQSAGHPLPPPTLPSWLKPLSCLLWSVLVSSVPPPSALFWTFRNVCSWEARPGHCILLHA